MAEKMKVVFTVDVENLRGNKPYLIEGNLCEFGIMENCGLDFVLGTLDKYGIKGVFFVNIYEHSRYDADYIPDVLKRIHARGHEIGLHSHTLVSETDLKIVDKHPLGRNAEEQIRVYDYGLDYIEKHTGERPVSFRAGGYRINDDTFPALAKLGMRIDSSVYWEHRTNEMLEQYAGTQNGGFEAYGITEIPVIVVWNGRRWSKLDMNAMTEDEIIQTFEILQKSGRSCAQIMCHSFSYMDQGKKQEGKKELILHGNKYIYGDSPRLKSRLERVLSFLSESDRFECVTFASMKKEDLDKAQNDDKRLVYLKRRELAFTKSDIVFTHKDTSVTFTNMFVGSGEASLLYGWFLTDVSDREHIIDLGYGKNLQSVTYVFDRKEDTEFEVCAVVGIEGEDERKKVRGAYYNIRIRQGVFTGYRMSLSSVWITDVGKIVK